jgi:hypothetical protein
MSQYNAGDWDLFADMAKVNTWLELSNGFSGHEDSMRVMKIGEEFGETVAAYIGMTGQNPRKGITHTQADVMAELADVAITAMCAMVHFAGGVHNKNSGMIARAHLASKIDGILKRADIK